MSAAELAVFATSGVLAARLTDAVPETLGGVAYIGFASEPELSGRDLAHLSNLSAAFALFERVGSEPGDDLLRPVALAPLAAFDDDLLTIQKYAGKTNEQFTKLLLNVTLLASASAGAQLDRRLVVLDPLCGRGTTLNQALMYGHSAIGIDTDGKDFDLYAAFVKTYLKRKRVKHHAEIAPVRKDKRTLARRLSVTIGDRQTLTVFHGDTTQAREFLKAAVADVIVADLPYGVAHGSQASGGLSRSPVRLLEAAVPVWAQLVRPGGAIGISWNTHVATRDEAAAILAGAGLKVCRGRGFDDLTHWVDQSITRDVLVAVRP